MTDILVVEDNAELREVLVDFLRNEGYTVSSAGDGDKALALYEKYGARLLVLDIMLPGASGMRILDKVREKSNTPVIMVSAKLGKDDKLQALISGADDYIEKPYDIDILIAKIKGIFKRRLAVDELSDDNITLDIAHEQILKDGEVVDATTKEFELLKLLMENKGQTLLKNYIFSTIWGSDSESEAQTLTVHIRWLREKLEDDPKNPKKIITVWGKGYRYE
ncbi:MAG: response regulator transcription factor [Butyrivibrio sp.]|uniref:response regulator transcription factor n=1 Tax=Butyrivibrio sp. TaxID=28121 RepID=UPI0025C4FDA2|nr:response regulator transcription factor [Butyrivibrio sp.]MBQ6587426.1 response regulator transcription factor [Butyrivibrio sp.]MBQ7614198.1 response regulator transcription factor [Butyrivibrio sp.]